MSKISNENIQDHFMFRTIEMNNNFLTELLVKRKVSAKIIEQLTRKYEYVSYNTETLQRYSYS